MVEIQMNMENAQPPDQWVEQRGLGPLVTESLIGVFRKCRWLGIASDLRIRIFLREAEMLAPLISMFIKLRETVD